MRALLLLLALMATPAAAADSPRPADMALLKTLRAADVRVATIGERLAIANVALCPRPVYRTGLLLHDIGQYSGALQNTAQALFRFERPITVEAVVPGSPAAQAGIAPDSALIATDGVPVDTLPAGKAAFGRMEKLLDRIDGQLTDGVLGVDMLDHGVRRQARIEGIAGCASRFQIVLGNAVNAAADGRYVQIEGKMVDFTANDNELAAVLAHELAHNILDHRARLDAAGVDRGLLGTVGRSAALIQRIESEADRLSVYLMTNAGYDAKAATGFWDRMGREHGLGIFSDATHLRRGPRVALFRRELTALDALRARMPKGQPLFPDFARRPFAPLR